MVWNSSMIDGKTGKAENMRRQYYKWFENLRCVWKTVKIRHTFKTCQIDHRDNHKSYFSRCDWNFPNIIRIKKGKNIWYLYTCISMLIHFGGWKYCGSQTYDEIIASERICHFVRRLRLMGTMSLDEWAFSQVALPFFRRLFYLWQTSMI